MHGNRQPGDIEGLRGEADLAVAPEFAQLVLAPPRRGGGTRQGGRGGEQPTRSRPGIPAAAEFGGGSPSCFSAPTTAALA